MNILYNLKLIWTFYKRVVSFNLIFTICALYLYVKTGSLLVFSWMFWLKVIGFASITYLYYEFRKQNLCFYYNLGFSNGRLLLIAAICEIIIFTLSILLVRWVINS